MLRNAGNVYSLELDISNDRGFVKLQTPMHTINPQVILFFIEI